MDRMIRGAVYGWTEEEDQKKKARRRDRMPNLASVALPIFVRRKPPGGFRDRLKITIVATVLDFCAILVFGPTAYACASISLLVPITFMVLAVGLFAVLWHMWVLTLKSWNYR
jgi:hypothetical protein